MNSGYPLANDLQGSMKNTNYKDWLAMCENNQQYGVNPAAINSSSVSTALKVAGAILKFVNPPAGTVLTVLSAVLPILWPTNTPTPERVWNDFMTNTGNLIDQTVTAYVRTDANAKMTVVKDYLDQYTTKFNTWKREPNNQSYRTAVITQFNLTSAKLRGTAVYFSNLVGYELLLLPIYGQVANFNLLLIRDGLIKAQEWSLARSAGDQLYNTMVQYTKEYIAHSITWYNKGLDVLRNKSNGQWITFNDYKREMTIQVLDILALFASYDPRRYPADKIDNTKLSKTEFTREIYTALVESPSSKSIAALEAALTRDVHLFIWLKRVDFWTNTIYQDLRFLSANKIGFSYTNSSAMQERGIYGSSGFGSNLTHQIQLNSNVYKTSITDTSSPSNRGTKMDFYKIDGTLASYNSNITPTPEGLRTTFFGFSTNENTPNQPTVNDYTHILSYIKTDVIGYNSNRVSFAWTHKIVDPNNQIYTDAITQVPAVKSNFLNATAKVIKGPGHTGGDLVALTSNGTLSGRMEIQCKTSIFNDPTRSYGFRIRYAANSPIVLNVSYVLQGVSRGTTISTESTFSRPNNIIPTDLKYEEFRYKDPFDAIVPMRLSSNQLITIAIQPLNMTSNNQVIIDRIEIIPITQSVLDETEDQNLESEREVVNALFTNDAKDALNIGTTDYDMDQAANLVECISEELYPKEKMLLLDEVKNAKQLSQSRNVLQKGGFESATLGWTTSDNITIQEDDPIFKGHYLHMSGARDIDGTIFPTYIFQKIDESKLKPYTRYLVRGFLGSSKDVELVVSRYGGEIDAIMNVPADLNYLYPSTFDCEGSNRCETSAVPANIGNTSDMLYSCQYDTGKKHVVCQDSHQFSFTIDTGALDTNENIGVWVMFKISSPDGYASLDNLEVIEEGPIDGEALSRVKHMEKKWNDQMEAKRSETQQAYDVAKQAIDALFTNVQDEALQFDTTLAQIQYAEYLVQSIPYVYNDWLSDVPGMNYDIYVELGARVAQARYLYDTRNIIKNGDFTRGVMGWHVTGNADVQQIDGVSVLVLSNWSAGVSQNVHLQHNHGCVLRVIAKKEGPGNGYVTLMDCEENQEKLTFTSCEEGYITKTVDVFPDTDRVRIEIGETEGSFYIESIELICMNE
uniref:Crystaline entomocidal protoxin n=1 Tax=Bacillus thuringiensis TaxID=1428 RepID=A9XIX4_BACTU|nr:pesticidal crystal protein [Bacillus thuringiensis]